MDGGCKKCSAHKDNMLEILCLDHKEPLCLLCLKDSKHKDCKNMVTYNNMVRKLREMKKRVSILRDEEEKKLSEKYRVISAKNSQLNCDLANIMGVQKEKCTKKMEEIKLLISNVLDSKIQNIRQKYEEDINYKIDPTQKGYMKKAIEKKNFYTKEIENLNKFLNKKILTKRFLRENINLKVVFPEPHIEKRFIQLNDENNNNFTFEAFWRTWEFRIYVERNNTSCSLSLIDEEGAAPLKKKPTFVVSLKLQREEDRFQYSSEYELVNNAFPFKSFPRFSEIRKDLPYLLTITFFPKDFQEMLYFLGIDFNDPQTFLE